MDLCHYVLIFHMQEKTLIESGQSFLLSPKLLEANIINWT